MVYSFNGQTVAGALKRNQWFMVLRIGMVTLNNTEQEKRLNFLSAREARQQ
ncbi:hypothetical protein C7475_107233 [Chitinophaga sp. S165]|nr:hypothetical protein C7475_107233 [Chitinophaga sp. S165]